MIVYGDRDEAVTASGALRALQRRLDDLAGSPTGLLRHAALVNLHIEAGRFAQGLADEHFDPEIGDKPSEEDNAWMSWLTRSGQAIVRSWESDFHSPSPPPLPQIGNGDRTLRLRLPEGFAFYGLYPESYIRSARRLPWRGPDVRVIGVRSIGASLAPVVAAAVEAPPPLTVRPCGHPFSRSLRLTRAAWRRLAGGTAFLIVDEGPGLSGSSLAAVARALLDEGVGADHIAFLPSHAGEPGSAASLEVRSLWRHVVRSPAAPSVDAHVMSDWTGAFLPAPVKRVSEMTGGAWRAARFSDPSDWPPVDPRTDRSKFLIEDERRGRWFARFVGLGRSGERKLDRAVALADGGWAPRPLALAHGFLIQPWQDSAAEAGRPPPRTVGRYLAYRRTLTTASEGADLQTLGNMALANITEGLGREAATRLAPLLDATPHLARQAVPIAVDGALDRWKWLWAGGRWLKMDALDHDADHDLIGRQDVAWDLAGGAVELDWNPTALDEASAELGADCPSPEMIEFMTLAYCAFRMGARALAADSSGDPQEVARNRADSLRYANAIRRRSPR